MEGVRQELVLKLLHFLFQACFQGGHGDHVLFIQLVLFYPPLDFPIIPYSFCHVIKVIWGACENIKV